MRLMMMGCSSAVLVGATLLGAERRGDPPATDLDRKVHEIAASAGAGAGYVEDVVIGASRQGRPIHVLRVGKRAGSDADHRPAVLIVAGTDAQHTVGVQVALGVADRLAAEQHDLLDRFTVYIAPSMNPDTVEFFKGAGVVKRDSAAGGGRTLTPDDADHDGRVDEDGPIDLNGDGVITMLRVADPPPGLGLERTVVIDHDDPRLVREPDKTKNERATHALVIEGRDQDGDGRIAEDGPGGVDLDKNFPYRWPEFRDGAGMTAISEPESRALVEWMMGRELTDGSSGNVPGRENIVAVIEYVPWDNQVTLLPDGRMDETNRVPVGIESDDKASYEQVAKAFKEITGMTGAPKGEAAWAGSAAGWAYSHFGALSFATPVWVRPDQIKRDDKAKDKPEEKKADAPAEGDKKPAEPAEKTAAQPPEQPAPPPPGATPAQPVTPPAPADRPPGGRRGGGRPGGGGGGGGFPGGGGRGRGGAGGGGGPAATPAVDAGEDGKWLKYFDERVAAGGEPGFVPWTPLEHPDLGHVEIGGFVPNAKINPPAEELPRLIEEQTKVVVDLLSRLPRLTVEPVRVERVGASVWRVSVRVVNDGSLPLRCASAVKARRLPPLRLTTDLRAERIVGGDRVVRAQSLAANGGSVSAEWLITGAEGDKGAVVVKCVELGDQRVEFTLKAVPAGEGHQEGGR